MVATRITSTAATTPTRCTTNRCPSNTPQRPSIIPMRSTWAMQPRRTTTPRSTTGPRRAVTLDRVRALLTCPRSTHRVHRSCPKRNPRRSDQCSGRPGKILQLRSTARRRVTLRTTHRALDRGGQCGTTRERRISEDRPHKRWRAINNTDQREDLGRRRATLKDTCTSPGHDP